MTQHLTDSARNGLTNAVDNVLIALQDPAGGEVLQTFKADPLSVVARFGGPVDALDVESQAELGSALRKLPIPDRSHPDLLDAVSWSCIGCEAGLNVVIVGAGGIAAILVAAAAGPEVLAASAVVVAIAEFTGIAATAVAGILMGVIGGGVLVGLEAAVAAICEATGACA